MSYQPWATSHFFPTISMLLWSEDQGETWNKPTIFPDAADGNRGLTEAAVAQIGPSQYVAAIRADDTVGSWDGFYLSYSFMSQMRSDDGGQTWDPAAYAAFPGYCISLTSTDSGALDAITRYPYFAAHVSWDGGVSWDDGTILDYAVWVNHPAIQVEPDVVAVIYMVDITRPGQPDTRFLRLRVDLAGLRLAE